MDPISAVVVEDTWQRMSAMSPWEAFKLVRQMGKEQPLILAYLMASGEEVLNEEERELLLYLGTVVWQIMSQGSQPLAKIEEEVLDEVEERNIKMLEYLKDSSDAEFFDTLQIVLDNYNQKEVLKYVIEALMEGEDEELDDEFDLFGEEDDFDDEDDEILTSGEELGASVRDEMKGIMMIYLKTVIDCFDR